MALNNVKPARDRFAHIVHYIAAPITFADNGKVVKVGTIPAGSQILKTMSGVHVNVAFNAGSTNVLDIGPSSDDDFLATDLALGSIAFVALDEAVTMTVTGDTEIIATVALSGTAASAGAGTVSIAYLPRIA